MKMNGLFRKLIAMALPFLVKKGVDYASRRGKSAGPATAGEKQLSSTARSATKRARQAARVTRKMR